MERVVKKVGTTMAHKRSNVAMSSKPKESIATKGAKETNSAMVESKSQPKKVDMSTKKKSKDENDFYEFFLDALRDLYWAENALSKALPKMQKAVTSIKLAKAIEEHIAETKEHANVLEEVFDSLGEKAKAVKCDAMAGLIEEAQNIINETNKGTMTRDAAIIAAVQKCEHYEIATYGTLAVFAETLGRNEVAKLLRNTLENEKETDAILTKIAVNYVNDQAVAE